MKWLLLFSSLCAFAACLPQRHEGQGCKVFRIVGAEEIQNGREKLLELATDTNYNFWTDIATNGATDIFVPAHMLEHFQNFMEQHGFSYSTMIQDVGALILHEKAVNNPGPTMDWENYHRYETILDFVTTSALAHSDIASVEEIGKSIENRTMIILKIGRPLRNKTKPAMFMEAGIHSNEWISPAVTTYFINELLNNSTHYDNMLSEVDLYILPMVNPDGYEFTHTDTRLWRKNRRPDPDCSGVNLNVNFGYHWGGNGSSLDKCSEVYIGSAAFSEPETANVRNFIERKPKEGVNWRAYYAMHSYAQMWLLPYGWTDELPEDYEDLKRFGNVGADALESVHGMHYEVGSLSELMEKGAGTSDDWAKGSGIFKYSQTIELRDTGKYGFLLPPEQIIPTAEETWAAIQANAQFLAAK